MNSEPPNFNSAHFNSAHVYITREQLQKFTKKFFPKTIYWGLFLGGEPYARGAASSTSSRRTTERVRVLALDRRQHILATPLGTKDLGK